MNVRQTQLLCQFSFRHIKWCNSDFLLHRLKSSNVIVKYVQKNSCCFCLHYGCMAMRLAEESKYCCVSLSLEESVKYTWYITLLNSTSSSNEGRLEKLFLMWDNVSLLSHRRHSDWVRNDFLIHAPGNSSSRLFFLLFFLLPSPSKFPHARYRESSFFHKLRLGSTPSHKILIRKDCNISSSSQFIGTIMWLSRHLQVWVTSINYASDSQLGYLYPRGYFFCNLYQ